MKVLSVIFLMLFMGISTANAAVVPANGAANANANQADPLRGDLTAALQSGLTIAEILASYVGSGSPYAITEVIGALTEVAGPANYDAILAETQVYAPSFVPVINEVINLYRADIAQGGVPGTVDPTAAFAASAAGPDTAAGNAAINAALAAIRPFQGNGVSGVTVQVTPGA